MSSQIDWHSQTPFTINKHTEYPVNCVFAESKRIDWFSAGTDPNLPIVPRPTEFPRVWQGSPGQPLIGRQGLQEGAKKAPWLYGETPDLQHLIGNAVPGYGV